MILILSKIRFGGKLHKSMKRMIIIQDCTGAPPLAVGIDCFSSNIDCFHVNGYYCTIVTNLRHYDNLNTARFLTFSCYHRFRLFSNDKVIQIFLEELGRVKENHGLRLLGYVVMPEHVHLVVWPPDGLSLGPVIGELKSWSARRMLPHLWKTARQRTDRLRIYRNGQERTVFWQRRCYDHNCRTTEIVREKINYCHNNPVKRGMVGTPGEWQWSSYNWYQGGTDVPILMNKWE